MNFYTSANLPQTRFLTSLCPCHTPYSVFRRKKKSQLRWQQPAAAHWHHGHSDFCNTNHSENKKVVCKQVPDQKGL
eukprot:TRINITY_DN851_c0_g1_i1.p1 TRINITY_DN851_c0_g1~~TRINITY_DN851_c0_g1_i1.p1  ORF type:complete len:76 (+),score=9.58 TRINITY_DN851_c0_g1_i1:100-327(+)